MTRAILVSSEPVKSDLVAESDQGAPMPYVPADGTIRAGADFVFCFISF